MPTNQPNPWKFAFWAQFIASLAVLLAALYGAYLGFGLLQKAVEEARQTTQAAQLESEQLQAERIGAVAKPISFKGTVADIIDGDTIQVRVANQEYRVRLFGIDCPESNQPFGKQAAERLGLMVDADTVQVRLTNVDPDGRLVGVVTLGGRAVNLELVEAGLAWWYEKYAPDDKPLAEAQQEARDAKRGLWAGTDPVPPWEWRRGGQAESSESPTTVHAD